MFEITLTYVPSALYVQRHSFIPCNIWAGISNRKQKREIDLNKKGKNEGIKLLSFILSTNGKTVKDSKSKCNT
ncbi:CLUMA_CG017897, isoform A [Clunio marinus]|uniref:CLUMA_CG017897, isoform A n=1 Tax=Clunio marinus TaxID=568069 RepID=A0A1J1IZ77_9DIPT|nr:CLUMA_CG017897, isoform A [Clunio marinus]